MTDNLPPKCKRISSIIGCDMMCRQSVMHIPRQPPELPLRAVLFEQTVLPEVIVGLGKIPLAPYGTPGTWELCARLERLAPEYDAILLENHGVVTCGQDLTTAYQRLETVEQFAKILLTAESLGGPHLLPHAEVRKLIAARSRYGVTSRESSVDFRPLPIP